MTSYIAFIKDRVRIWQAMRKQNHNCKMYKSCRPYTRVWVEHPIKTLESFTKRGYTVELIKGYTGKDYLDIWW